jgi:lipopolysaccharide/colanic/teichoic acid biosynthesis glycosyltransferase
MAVEEKERLPEIEMLFRDLEWHAPSREVRPRSLWIIFFDTFFATIGILVALVPIIMIGIAIKLDSKGPIFFTQKRLGQYKKPFWLIKFRTMVTNAEDNGPMWANENDSRVTRVGYILRKARLDELPQLFNILMGNLSFVGPRPIRKYFADLLRQYNSEYDKRFLVKPGLSGWAQIFAPYGSTIEEQLTKVPYDLRYLKGLSVKDYLMIILLTIKTVVTGNGV